MDWEYRVSMSKIEKVLREGAWLVAVKACSPVKNLYSSQSGQVWERVRFLGSKAQWLEIHMHDADEKVK